MSRSGDWVSLRGDRRRKMDSRRGRTRATAGRAARAPGARTGCARCRRRAARRDNTPPSAESCTARAARATTTHDDSEQGEFRKPSPEQFRRRVVGRAGPSHRQFREYPLSSASLTATHCESLRPYSSLLTWDTTYVGCIRHKSRNPGNFSLKEVVAEKRPHVAVPGNDYVTLSKRKSVKCFLFYLLPWKKCLSRRARRTGWRAPAVTTAQPPVFCACSLATAAMVFSTCLFGSNAVYS